jgi:hypothetical protein
VTWVRRELNRGPPLVCEVNAKFADRGCQVVSATDPYYCILCFLYLFFQVAPQLYSRGWMYSDPDLLLLRKSGCAGNLTRTSRSIARNSDALEIIKIISILLGDLIYSWHETSTFFFCRTYVLVNLPVRWNISWSVPNFPHYPRVSHRYTYTPVYPNSFTWCFQGILWRN